MKRIGRRLLTESTTSPEWWVQPKEPVASVCAVTWYGSSSPRLLDSVNAYPLISVEHNSSINLCHSQTSSWWVAGLIGALSSDDPLTAALPVPKAPSWCVSGCQHERKVTQLLHPMCFSNWTVFTRHWNTENPICAPAFASFIILFKCVKDSL